MIQFKSKQYGSATILSSVAVLMLITMVTLMSANVSVMETKTSSNDYRTLQALMSAQAGIDFALTNLSKNDLGNIAETQLTYDDNGTDITTGYYTVAVDSTVPNKLVITSTGQSADKSATKQLAQRLIFATALRNDATQFISAPLITSGAANIDHTIIIDGQAPARVWSGGIITTQAPGSLPGTVGSDPEPLRKLAAKLYEKDPITANPLNTLFSTQMRADQNQGIKHISINHDCSDAACENPALLTTAAGRSKIHYVQGGLTLDGETVGTATNPVFIIVDLSAGGTLTLSGNTIVNGIVVVLGSFNAGNNQSYVNGALIVDGNVSNANRLNLNFDITVLNNMSSVGVYTRIPGSWTDS